MLEPIPFWGMIEVDLPVKTYAGDKPNYIKEYMNNEPVAWMSPDGKVSDTEGKLFYIPLYTHPVDAVNISQECVDKKQNNRHEPVAWIEEDGMVKFDVRWASQMQGKEPIPLYTHPVK